MKRSWLARLVAAVTIVAGTVFGLPAAAQAAGNIIQNAPGSGGKFVRIGVGVMHFFDDSYTHGAYDTTLQPGASTNLPPINWSTAGGIYIGPGYCAQIRLNGVHEYDIEGPIQHPVEAGVNVIVTPYRAPCY